MITILTQPITDKLTAAYRPIILIAKSDVAIPVCYCDVYINDIFYKTFSKTQFINDNEFEFDIQDALQEYIKKYLHSNGGNIFEYDILHKVFCRFRSSSINGNGFLIPEPIIPIQGTGGTNPTAGTGVESNSFFVINAVLQHTDNQNLEDHLNYFKNFTWANNIYPLTHRPSKYKICLGDNDFFPIINKGNTVKCLRVQYKLKGSVNLNQSNNICFEPPPFCQDVAYFPGHPFDMPDAEANVLYTYAFEVTGDAPFTLDNIIKPAWLNITIVGNIIQFEGTPSPSDIGFNINVSLQVKNCSNGVINFNKNLNIFYMPPGIIVMWSGLIANIPAGWALCDGTSGTPNLKGKFIVSYSDVDPDYNVIGNAGGAKQVTLNLTEIPSHDHFISGGLSVPGVADYLAIQDSDGPPNYEGYALQHSTIAPTKFKTSLIGGNSSHENRPPYYTLAYIMKL